MYPLVYPFMENSPDHDIDSFFDLISEFGPFDQVILRKNTFGTVRDVPVHAAVRLQTVDDNQKKSCVFHMHESTPSRQIGLIHSFLGVWRSLKALCPL